MLFQIPQRYRFSSKSQHNLQVGDFLHGCFRYHKGTDFQANHNRRLRFQKARMLFQIPQRYRFSSKSQLSGMYPAVNIRCFRYHKGTDFQANHNHINDLTIHTSVVLDTTKVQIFKQITTTYISLVDFILLFQIPQRYRFSSKSQHTFAFAFSISGCFRYHKGTDFQANHNAPHKTKKNMEVVLDTTKVQIFKQITTQYNFIY